MNYTAATKRSGNRISWNLITFATVAWIYPLLKLGYKKPLLEEDLPLLGTNEQAVNCAHWLDKYIAQTQDQTYNSSEKPKLSLFPALFPHVAPIIAADALCQIISVAMTTLLSLMIGEILNFVNPAYPRENLFINNGYVLSLLMLAMQLLYTFAIIISESVAMVLEVRVKAALINAIYKKSLTLSSKSRRKFSAGKINSLVGSDTVSIIGFIESLNKVWSMPLQVGLSLYFVAGYLGASTGVATGVFVGLGIVSTLLSAPLGTGFKAYMTALDKRTSVLREFLYGVKVVKYHALEEQQRAKIQATRDEQVKSLYTIIFGLVLQTGAIIAQQTMTSPLTFITFGALGNSMQPQTIFPALSFLSSLLSISGQLPQIVFTIIQALTSYQRLSNFLLAEETNANDLPAYRVISLNPNEPSIVYKAASFTWEQVVDKKNEDVDENRERNDGSETVVLEDRADSGSDVVSNKDVFVLENVSLEIKRSSLVAVVGATGSGKSSLLSSISGSMRKTGGEAIVYGKIGYCPQEPWIISGTIQENITLMDDTVVPQEPWIISEAIQEKKTFMNNRCQEAIEACALTKDLKSFPSGIKTRIGEKGINLSGGQKARISLGKFTFKFHFFSDAFFFRIARAIAKNPDVFVLDDPLSALDAHVSKDIFNDAITGLMSSKTVIIATHLLHILPKVDQVIVMDQGKIVQSGSFSELMVDVNGKLFDTMKDYHLDEENIEIAVTEKVLRAAEKESTDSIDEDAEAEDRETGAVSFSTYKSFAHAIGFQWIVVMAIAFLVLTGCYVSQQLTLSAWTTDYWRLSNPNISYLVLYSVLAGVNSIGDVLNYGFALYVCVRGAQYFHDKAMDGLMKVPMMFYDVQPIGRILNRMTADVRSLDNRTGIIVSSVFSSVYLATGILIITCISAWQIIREL
ncbi:Multidrug resistance-associated protein 1 [Physocladia obscura]|uniref:Multidrug resistance-associated protein 1 n=1 Tax=Physocladia obscura TaxID=109957 RepID=A0AAD5T455_9FUNG|nr:Multidrug resistance-associated protein 1 [Physocladia obscura]